MSSTYAEIFVEKPNNKLTVVDESPIITYVTVTYVNTRLLDLTLGSFWIHLMMYISFLWIPKASVIRLGSQEGCHVGEVSMDHGCSIDVAIEIKSFRNWIKIL